jgi:hypothetical protein
LLSAPGLKAASREDSAGRFAAAGGPGAAHAAGHGQENQAMPVYKVFTWNMQRAQSVSRPRQDAMIMERYRVLKALVDWADFGFITEPGIDIRNNLNNFNLPGLNRNFCASQIVDNQTYASACRPVIYSAIREFVDPKRFRSYVSL